MTSYQPRVECRHGSAPPMGNCKHLSDTMMASSQRKTFGDAKDPQAYIKLPKELFESRFDTISPFASSFGLTWSKTTGDRQCKAIIQTAGATDVSTFYEMWEAIVAVNGMCVRFGNTGTALQRGTQQMVSSYYPCCADRISGEKRELSVSLVLEPKRSDEA